MMRRALSILSLLLLTAGWAGPALAQLKDPVVLVRLMPSVIGWLSDPDSLLRDEPLEMVSEDTATGKLTPIPPVADCKSLQAAQAAGNFTVTTLAMARESVVSDVCRVGQRYVTAKFETTESPKTTLHADVLFLWSAWFQLTITANVADAVEDAVRRGVSLGAFSEPSVASCGPHAVERKDPWTITAINNCDTLYLSVVGEEYTASGAMHPIVFYHLNATGGTLRTGGYTAVAPHPASGVWTPIEMLER